MAKGLRPEKKIRILDELDRASRTEKSEIMTRYKVDKQAVYKWRRARAEGRLGAKRGRRKNPELEREIGRLAGLPAVLEQIRKADPSLAADPGIPEPAELRKEILEAIVDRVDSEDLPWNGEIDADWDERLRADLLSRASRRAKEEERASEKKQFEPGDWDYLRETPANTPEDLCRSSDCPCTRFCRVQHVHAGAAGSRRAPGTITWADLPPAKHVCQSLDCVVNQYCASPIFGGPMHAHYPKAAAAPRPALPRSLSDWSSVEDCPWRERCDPRHERLDESEMEIWGMVQAEWYPIRSWCLAPKCEHHRRGAPHIHCRRCGAVWPAFGKYRELDLATMSRMPEGDNATLCGNCCLEAKHGKPENDPQ